jgi:hypothetical protein
MVRYVKTVAKRPPERICDMSRCSLLAAVAFAASLAALVPPRVTAQETRSAYLDVILLVDKSLSMVKAEAGVRKYAEGEIIGPVLVPGDRLIIETFYGKVDRLYAGTIRSEEDKAAIVRKLDAVVPNGRFTDIGAALDRAKADLAELGMPERPKYVLLLTDERQEAPYGTKYYAPDYKLVHPALKYVRRVDLGLFRAITVGFDVEARVDATAPGVMRLLEEPPARRTGDYPALPKGTDGGLSGAAVVGGPTANPRATGGEKLAPPSGASTLGRYSLPILLGVAVLAALFLAAVIVRVVQLRNRRREDTQDT